MDKIWDEKTEGLRRTLKKMTFTSDDNI